MGSEAAGSPSPSCCWGSGVSCEGLGKRLNQPGPALLGCKFLHKLFTDIFWKPLLGCVKLLLNDILQLSKMDLFCPELRSIERER